MLAKDLHRHAAPAVFTDGARRRIEELLEIAGIRADGEQPWDPRIHDRRFYHRVLAQGTLGLGESYMDGWWDCPRLDEFVARVIRARLGAHIKGWVDYLRVLQARLFNLQNPARAMIIGQRHYDVGNNLYEVMLDRRMIYSCGYWENASTLEEAQQAKLDLVCRKLELQPGMRVLDIGCGWGSAAKFAAERYGVEVLGVTVSEQQVAYAKKLCAGLPVDIRLCDYRHVRENFDRVYSIGMFEHVGYKNYRTFMEVVERCLDPQGLFLLHTIGGDVSVAVTEPWIARYIFPNSMLPSPAQIGRAIEGRFVVEDWHSFGTDYDTTLMHWYRNVNDGWARIRDRYDERFHRMWNYYLLSCAGSFRARYNHVWQLVLAPRTREQAYRRSMPASEPAST